MKYLLLCLSLLSVGCATTHNIQTDNVDIKFTIVDELPNRALATALFDFHNNICLVKIRRDVYPYCIVHEIRHCVEGNWHEGVSTTYDCFVK